MEKKTDETTQALDKLVLTLAKSIPNTDILFEVLSRQLPRLSEEDLGDSLLRLADKGLIDLSTDGEKITVLEQN